MQSKQQFTYEYVEQIERCWAKIISSSYVQNCWFYLLYVIKTITTADSVYYNVYVLLHVNAVINIAWQNKTLGLIQSLRQLLN